MSICRKTIRAAILFLALAQMPFSFDTAIGEVRVRERIQHYAIAGNSGVELLKAMNAKGPVIGNERALAATSLDFDIGDPDLAVRNGRCIVRDVVVTVKLTYYLPKWRGSGRASPGLRGAWKAYYAELVRHEKRHGEIYTQSFRQLERMLKGLSGTVAYGCRDFGAFFAMRLLAWANRHNFKQGVFDHAEHYPMSRILKFERALYNAQ